MTELPIACSLDAAGAVDRQRLVAELWAHAWLLTEPTAGGVRAHLRNSPHIADRVRQLIEAEGRCCPFLTFELTTTESHLLLDISGPADARPVIDDFFNGAAA